MSLGCSFFKLKPCSWITDELEGLMAMFEDDLKSELNLMIITTIMGCDVIQEHIVRGSRSSVKY